MSAFPFELRLAIFVALVACSTAMTIAILVKAVRALRRGETYVFAGWDGGSLFGGRSIHPRWALFGAVPMALMSAMLTWGVITQRWPKPDIVFEIPNGWLDVSSVGPPANYERLPAELRARVRATAGGLKRYAIDVDHADFEREGFAAFGAGYVHGDGDVSEASVREYARQALAEAGVSDGRITAVEVRSIGSARMGRAVIDVESLGMRLYFYTFAKGRTFARMSCSMPSISLGELGVVAVFLHGLIALLVTGK